VKPKRYDSPLAFKRAVEDRLKAASASGVDFSRRRQLLVFDRLLARLAVTFGEAVMLKGGLVLELRLHRARTTKDVDLRLPMPSADVLPRLRASGQLDLGDFMAFDVQPDSEHPEILGDGARYEGYRYRAECRLAGKLYGQPFGIDVAFGDPLFGNVDLVTGADLLGFAGVAPPRIRLYPVETHVAEKLHAYTLPRNRLNTRVKDLPDLALLGTVRPLDGGELRSALEQVFSFRRTQPLPDRMPPAPGAWEVPYSRLAKQEGLPWRSLPEVEAAARAFLDPVLGLRPAGRWDPVAWSWRRPR
jgi:hypothetical protein